ncbi:pseudouridine synthase [Draconibacterium sp. IB214405]|uniref:RluA family pseudouridine synthase n=1 Tax=Draconibacterium sp. IB214405 TaxID=3097352 RepID=UPI002A183293|nr:pseudouridine synthase [Draconibacterium sp. IB214405]MDX8339531.1 pseudouridine synthase [Draconibacterium sp. IB214405]
MNIPVLYQDDAIIVVEKPIELPVHKNDFMPNDAPYLTKLIGDETGKWIYNVHRLDSKTSGVIVLAFSSEVASVLTKQFEQKEVQKTYFAIVQGNPGEGTFDSKVLVKKKSKFKKPAVTHYKTIRTVQTKLVSKDKTDIELSLVEINPETGRWHQLRQHFAKNRFDIIGDTHHGDFTLNKKILADTDLRRLFLHAGKLEFKHPVSGETVSFESAVPEKFDQLLNFYLADE